MYAGGAANSPTILLEERLAKNETELASLQSRVATVERNQHQGGGGGGGASGSAAIHSPMGERPVNQLGGSRHLEALQKGGIDSLIERLERAS